MWCSVYTHTAHMRARGTRPKLRIGDKMCGSNPCTKPDCTWSESHRKACEIRHVMRLSPSQRSEHYSLVAIKRGEKASRELMAAVKSALDKRQKDRP
jgi:hypothetical protein